MVFEMNLWRGDYIEVLLKDGTVMRGTLEKVGADHIVIDEDSVFGDWVFIYFVNIINIEVR